MQQELSLGELNRTKGDNSKDREEWMSLKHTQKAICLQDVRECTESRMIPDSDLQKWITSLTRHEPPEGK